jgi:hypothetical protein
MFHQYKDVIDVFSRQLGQWDWAVMDSMLCEAIHPIREGRRTHWVGKSKSKGRWMVGIRVVVIVSPKGDILDWQMDAANIHDKHFAWMVEDFEIQVLTDTGFHPKKVIPKT